MKISVEKEKFAKALQRVNSIIASRTMLPVLSNVLMEAGDESLTLTTTDLEIRISTSIPAQVAEKGRTTVNARKLFSLVSCFSGKDVELTSDENNHMNIVCNTSKFKLLGLDAADFPEESLFDEVRKIQISESEFKKMVSSISYAVSPDDSRKALTGIFMSVSENIITAVATDGKRLAVQESVPESISGTAGDCIIPLKSSNEVRRLLDGNGSMLIRIGEKQCEFSTANFKLTTKLIEGNYPNYKAVLPASFKQQIEIDSAKLTEKISMVSQILSDSSSYVIMSFDSNILKIQASSTDIGEGSDIVEVEYAAEPLEISFNPNFLLDCLKNTSSDKIIFKVNDALTPVLLEGQSGFLYVIMPIRKK